MANLNMAVLLGALLIGVAVSGVVVDRDRTRPPHAVRITLPAHNAHSLTSTDASGGHRTVIEQADGLVIVDAGTASIDGRDAVARIRAFSDKPVKFLVYTNDDGGRRGEDRAYRQAWPDIVIISTGDGDSDPADGLMDALPNLADGYTNNIAAMIETLNRIDLLSPIRMGLEQMADTGRSILEGYKNLVRIHIKVSSAVPKRTVGDRAG